MHRRRRLSLASVLATLALSGVASADDLAAAKALFEKGVEQMEAGHLDEGCPSLAESYRLDPRPGSLFTLAECEAKRGHVATAVARYDQYLALYETLTPDKKAAQHDRKALARSQKTALAVQVPELTLTLAPPVPPGTEVTRDGAVLEASALGTPFAVDPGAHVVTTKAPNGPVNELRVTLAKGEKMQIVLEILAAPEPGPSASPEPKSDSGPSGRRVGAYVAGGVGIAGVVIGAVTGGLVLSKRGVISADCTDAGNGVERCRTSDAIAAGNSAKALGLASTICWVIGVAGLGVGTVLFVTEPARAKPVAGQKAGPPRSHRRWVGVGVLSGSSAGSVLGLEGTW